MKRHRMYRVASIALLLGFILVGTGCMSLMAGAPTHVTQSYDLPKDLDATDVIHAVERSFTQALSTAPRVVEGEVPSPLPSHPLHFTLSTRTAYLDHLGSVLIPSVTCPQHLAVISAWPANPDSLGSMYHYIACIQPYAEGYRVTIVASAPHAQHPLRSEPSEENEVAPVSHIAKVLLTEISLMRGHVAPALEPAISHATGKLAFLTHTKNALLHARPPAGRHPLDAPAALPLVCLAPKDHPAMLQSQPGGGSVVGTVEMGSVMAVAEPLDTGYFKVETERGSAGWISRSEVTRLPCPVG